MFSSVFFLVFSRQIARYHPRKKQKNIIPILLEGFEGFPENLPADIKDVAKKNGPQYNQYYFDEFYKKLKTDFLETRKSRFFSLKTILILSALILCAGGIWNRGLHHHFR